MTDFTEEEPEELEELEDPLKPITEVLSKSEINALCSQYVALKTLEKAVKEKLGELNSTVKEIMREGLEIDGTDRRRVRLNGQQIGTITACTSTNDFMVTNEDKFTDWLLDYNFGTVEHKANVKASEEIWSLLTRAYDEDAISHLFFTEPKPYRETLKNIFCVEDVCLYSGMPLAIPGIKPKPKELKNIMVKDTHLPTCLSALSKGAEGGLAGLLGGN